MNPDAIIKTVRRQGFNVGETRLVDVRAGKTFAMVDATSTKTGERWSVQAATDYGAAIALADKIGIAIPNDFDDINRKLGKLGELGMQGGDHEAEQELLGRLDEIEFLEGIEAIERERVRSDPQRSREQ